LHEDVVLLFDEPECKTVTAAPVVEADPGRIETRTATVFPQIDWLQKQHQWPGLKAIGKVERGRETPDKTTTETAFPAERGTHAGAIRRSRSPALGSGESAARAAGRGDERGSGAHPTGQRPAQPCRAATHGPQGHAERRIKRLFARKIQTRRMG